VAECCRTKSLQSVHYGSSIKIDRGEPPLLNCQCKPSISLKAIGIRSQQIQPQLCALVSYGVNPANEEYAYLNEEAIELWRSVLRYASALTPDLASLLPLVVGLLQAGTDTLPNALKILESYCLLDADILLQNYGTEVFTSFELLLGDQKMETVKTLLHAFNLLISRSHPTSWRERLDASNCFTKLVQPLNKEVRLSLLLSKIIRVFPGKRPDSFQIPRFSFAHRCSGRGRLLCATAIDR